MPDADGKGRYLGRKPSFTREQLGAVQGLVARGAGVSAIADATGLTRQTVYMIKADPAEAEKPNGGKAGGRRAA